MVTESDTGASERAPKVVAHRGASRAFPENTLAAFCGAAELGADGVELDVRRTADRQLVVHHDAALPGAEAPLCSQRRRELPPSVCTLMDALAVCERTSPPLAVNIEIKSDPGEPDYDPEHWVAAEVVRTLHAAAPTVPILVTSFDLGAIDRVRALDPDVPTGLLSFRLDDPAKVVDLAAGRGHLALNPWDPMTTPALADAAHAAGLEVNVWTVDDPDRIRELAAWGVDGVITNDPVGARDALLAR
jgi:glycerophosphoryl diester phosphodiesterase